MRYFYFSVLLLLFVAPNVSRAQGNLLVFPRRLVFEGAKRVQEINLSNVGTDSALYTISAIQYRMDKVGNFIEIKEPDSGQLFATKFIRYFPHSVRLAPNEGQVIKVQLVNTAELKPGEYRSHFYLAAIPKVGKSITDKEDTSAAKKQLSIKLIAQYGFSIPVIVRVGTSNTATTITNALLRYQDDKPVLQMDINRTGNMSDYGDLIIKYQATNGVITDMNTINGLSVYTPNAVRTVNIGLTPKSGQDLRKGKLLVTYKTAADARPQAIFAQAELVLK